MGVPALAGWGFPSGCYCPGRHPTG